MMQDDQESKKSNDTAFIDSVKRQALDRKNVPAALHKYIPYAEIWGISDDLEREDLVNRAPDQAMAELKQVIQEIDSELDEWLAGHEADSACPSQEYIAFSAMRMAVDFM